MPVGALLSQGGRRLVEIIEDGPGVAQPAGQSLELDVVAGSEPGAGDVVDVVAGGGQLPLDTPPIASDRLPPPVELTGRIHVSA